MKIIEDDQYYKKKRAVNAIKGKVVISTRYALDVSYGRVDVDEEWFLEREKLFASICLPSVVNQTHRDIHWLLGFSQRHEKYADRISNLIANKVRAKISLQVVDYETDKNYLRSMTKDTIGLFEKDDEYVITIRLDNDDALNVNFCRATVSYAQHILHERPELEDFWICFPFGAQVSNRNVNAYVYTSNPFLARVQKIGDKSKLENFALGLRHTILLENDNVFLPFATEPMWLQSIHDKNVLNKVKTDLELKNGDAILKMFGINSSEQDSD